jgi:hypothetical protein
MRTTVRYLLGCMLALALVGAGIGSAAAAGTHTASHPDTPCLWLCPY